MGVCGNTAALGHLRSRQQPFTGAVREHIKLTGALRWSGVIITLVCGWCTLWGEQPFVCISLENVSAAVIDGFTEFSEAKALPVPPLAAMSHCGLPARAPRDLTCY